MTPLSIFWLQPISYLSEIGICTKLTIKGSIWGKKNGMHTLQITIFPSISYFVANIMYFTPKMTPSTSFLLPCISYLSRISISTIPDHPIRAQKIPFSFAFLFCNFSFLVFVAVLGLWLGPRQSGLVDMPIPERCEIGCSKKMGSGVILGVEHLI